VAFAITAPLAGLFARWYFRHLGQRRQMLRFAYLELKHGYYVQNLRQLRRQVIEEMDTAMAEYLRYLSSREDADSEDAEPGDVNSEDTKSENDKPENDKSENDKPEDRDS
jgi:hypothetical protein